MSALFSNWPRHVYVASDDRGRHKIGITNNPRLRRYHLGRDLGCPVEIVHTEPLSPEAEAVECAAHWILAERHEGREWFAVSRDEALQALEQAKAQVSDGALPTVRLSTVGRYGLPATVARAVTAACRAGETPSDFIRQAVEAELRKREKPSKG